jgi:hypothetical protein
MDRAAQSKPPLLVCHTALGARTAPPPTPPRGKPRQGCHARPGIDASPRRVARTAVVPAGAQTAAYDTGGGTAARAEQVGQREVVGRLKRKRETKGCCQSDAKCCQCSCRRRGRGGAAGKTGGNTGGGPGWRAHSPSGSVGRCRHPGSTHRPARLVPPFGIASTARFPLPRGIAAAAGMTRGGSPLGISGAARSGPPLGIKASASSGPPVSIAGATGGNVAGAPPYGIATPFAYTRNW